MEAIIFIGIQATGKSSFYKRHFFNSHIRISLDLLNTRNKQNIFLNTCFETHTQFVVDNTNPTKEDRAYFINLAKENKYKIIGYYFNSKINAAIARNDKRVGKEKIPEVGIRSCYSKLVLPSYTEGFDELFYVSLSDGEFLIEDWKDEI